MLGRVLLLLSGVIAADPAAAAADFRYGLSGAATWAENVSRSSRSPDARDAFVGEASFSARYDRPLARYWSARVQLAATARAVPEFERTSTTEAEGELTVQRKLGLGTGAPVFAASATLRRRDARMQAADAWVAEASLRASKRVTDTVRLSLTGDWREDYARHAAFDTRTRRLGADAAWDITERWQAAAGAGRLWGEFTTHASPSSWSESRSGQLGPDIAAYYSTVAWLVTDSYGPGWVSYRVDGRADVWWLEVAPALGERTALVLRYENIHAKNQVSENYRQQLWTLRLVHEF